MSFQIPNIPEGKPADDAAWLAYEMWFTSPYAATSRYPILTVNHVATFDELKAKFAANAETVPSSAAEGTQSTRKILESHDPADDDVRDLVVKIRTDEHDRRVEALDRLLAGRSDGYSSIRAAFYDVTGTSEVARVDFSRAMLGKQGYSSAFSVASRLREGVTSSTFANALGDAIHRRLVALYNTQPGLSGWRSIVSNQRFNCDFRAQRMDRIGGYGLLPTVNPSAPYNPLPTPATNDEASYSATKKGGSETFTYEAFVNDDITLLTRAISSLARAAANTINRSILDTFPTNANIYNGAALFVAGHNNITATALSAAALDAIRIKMRKQAVLNDAADVIGAVPRILVVPPELELTALGLLPTYNAASLSNRADLQTPIDLVVAGHYASATSWFVVADPASCPTIEVGFVGASADPDVILQKSANVGSSFDADVITIKLRHIWGHAVADFRGLAKGN